MNVRFAEIQTQHAMMDVSSLSQEHSPFHLHDVEVKRLSNQDGFMLLRSYLAENYSHGCVRYLMQCTLS